MERKTSPRRPVVKEYTIVKARYGGAPLPSPLGPILTVEGPYEILEDHLLDARAAGRRARELERELNPTRDTTSGVHVFLTNRGADYRPKPVRYSTYEIVARFAYRETPIVIDLPDVRRSPSAKKAFRDYLGRVRAHDAEPSARRRVYGGLWSAELRRKDWFKGKPAGGETVMTDSDVPRRK